MPTARIASPVPDAGCCPLFGRRSVGEFAPPRVPASLLPQHQVHHPTAPDVFARLSAVGEDVLALAPGVLEGIRENRHGGEVSALVHLAGDRKDGGREPRGLNGHRAEGVAENVPKKPSLLQRSCIYRGSGVHATSQTPRLVSSGVVPCKRTGDYGGVD